MAASQIVVLLVVKVVLVVVVVVVKCKKGPVALTSPIKVAFIYLFIYSST